MLLETFVVCQFVLILFALDLNLGKLEDHKYVDTQAFAAMCHCWHFISLERAWQGFAPIYCNRISQVLQLLSFIFSQDTHRALWFPQSRNRGQNHDIGQWKWYLLLNAVCHKIDCNLTEILFSGERGTFI